MKRWLNGPGFSERGPTVAWFIPGLMVALGFEALAVEAMLRGSSRETVMGLLIAAWFPVTMLAVSRALHVLIDKLEQNRPRILASLRRHTPGGRAGKPGACVRRRDGAS